MPSNEPSNTKYVSAQSRSNAKNLLLCMNPVFCSFFQAPFDVNAGSPPYTKVYQEASQRIKKVDQLKLDVPFELNNGLILTVLSGSVAVALPLGYMAYVHAVYNVAFHGALTYAMNHDALFLGLLLLVLVWAFAVPLALTGHIEASQSNDKLTKELAKAIPLLAELDKSVADIKSLSSRLTGSNEAADHGGEASGSSFPDNQRVLLAELADRQEKINSGITKVNSCLYRRLFAKSNARPAQEGSERKNPAGLGLN